ncbi:MAG: SirB2 family protein [Gammaproteobacteria bacterium]|nr:SirB2 family protein [Gammaproteobacteria bacterium]MDH5240662.1 SirB2 family protein [Gammaproteobacteria bacterium]MDH5260537.1 SirB2 family protein [Gammaproteobacteria bacterium]MDH5583786.1 SirB2 family protein [Gammaproteobacteria bacterium]
MLYWITKSLHMFTAIATISGFMLRGYWMMTESDRLQLRITRIAPHIIDTIFLLSGIALVFMLHLNAFTQPWLLAKFAGLVVYIVLGIIALKRGATRQIRVVAFVAALATFGYIVGVATAKSPASWLSLFAV